jgi:predicted regulator of Ras-like GTPase activity (Roadblock/LC7/MglB family)
MTVDVEIENRISKCQKILEMDPNSQIFAALAEAYRRKGELEKAFQVCHNGLRLHPNYGPAHLVMAKVNLDRGLYDWAETEVQKARQVEGNNRTIELLLAEINIYKGEFQVAIKSLRRLAVSDPGNDHVKRLLEIAMRIPQEQQAQNASSASSATGPLPVAKGPEAMAPRNEAPVRLTPADLLAEAVRIDGVDGAMFINTEGLVIESQWRATMEPAVCGAAIAEVSKFLDQELMKISFGRVGTVLIETPIRIFHLVRVSGGMFLLTGKASINLGSLRMKMATLLDRVQTN